MRTTVALLAFVSWLVFPQALAWTCIPHYYDNIPAWLYAFFGIVDMVPSAESNWDDAYRHFALARRQGLFLQIVQLVGMMGIGILMFHLQRLVRRKDWQARRTILFCSALAVIPWAVVAVCGCSATYVTFMGYADIKNAEQNG